MRLNQKTAILTAAIPLVRLNVTGNAVRCIGADEDFEIAFDGGAPIPFGLARRVAPTDSGGRPQSFSSVDVYRASAAAVVSNRVSLVIGDADYSDQRIALFPQQGIRNQSFTSVRGVAVDVVPAAAGIVVANVASQATVNLRNLHATVPIYISSELADLASSPPAGFYLGPGENCDFWCLNPLYARHDDAAETVKVQRTVFLY